MGLNQVCSRCTIGALKPAGAQARAPVRGMRGLDLGGAAVSARVISPIISLVISPGSSPPAVEGY